MAYYVQLLGSPGRLIQYGLLGPNNLHNEAPSITGKTLGSRLGPSVHVSAWHPAAASQAGQSWDCLCILGAVYVFPKSQKNAFGYLDLRKPHMHHSVHLHTYVCVEKSIYIYIFMYIYMFHLLMHVTETFYGPHGVSRSTVQVAPPELRKFPNIS